VARTDRQRVERAARMYHTTKDASRALGIAPGSFCRLCKHYDIESPGARRRKKLARRNGHPKEGG
jgi:hypothetical protein